MKKNNKFYVDEKSQIEPFFNENAVMVSFVADTTFVDFLGVAINSIVQNATDACCYDILVITTDITDSQIDKVLTLIKGRDNFSIRFVYINLLVQSLQLLTCGEYNHFTYYRLMLPDIVKNTEKILYLDSDVVVNTDIAELYNWDMEEKAVLGTYDVQIASWQNYDSGMRSYFKALKINNPGEYVQAGVLLFNLKLMRQICDLTSVLKVAGTQKFIFNDQDLINIYFKGNIKIIPLEWNVLNLSSEGIENCSINLGQKMWHEFEIARKNPKIVHYAEKSFPCCAFNRGYAELYWKYAENTVFFDNLVQRKKSIEEQARDKENHLDKMECLRNFGTILFKKMNIFCERIIRKSHSIITHKTIIPLSISSDNTKWTAFGIPQNLFLKAGKEISCLRDFCGNGDYNVTVRLKCSNQMQAVRCEVVAGCRHIQIAKKKLKNGKNSFKFCLEESCCDFEIIIKNSSAEDIIVKKAELEYL